MTFNGKILLADDEAHIRKFIGLILKQLGSPTIVEARNGEEAVALFAAEAPDLVLLDVNMPVLDGVQALTQIRAQSADAAVVMLTSLVNRQTVEECSRLGALAYLRKDATRDELKKQLEQVFAENFGEPPPNP